MRGTLEHATCVLARHRHAIVIGSPSQQEPARAAGLDRSTPAPRCLAHRRDSDVRANQQLFFVIFDLPEYARFRQQVAALLGTGPSRANFDSDAQSPILFVAVAESTFQRWLPLRADPQADCVAPIEVTAATRR